MDAAKRYNGAVDYNHALRIHETAQELRNSRLSRTQMSAGDHDEFEGVVESVRKDGVAALNKHILVDDIRAQVSFMEKSFTFQHRRLAPALLPSDDLTTLAEEKRITFEDCSDPSEFSERLAKAALVSIKNPLIDNLELLRICADHRLTNIASQLLGAPAALTWVKMTRSLPNFSEAFNTQQFHIDRGAVKTIKFFIFLTCPSLNGGFFKYWRESHLDGRHWWENNMRLTDQCLYDFYGFDKLSSFGNSMFDIVVANTIGVHAGCVPNDLHRDLLIISYGLHNEFSWDGSQDSQPLVQQRLIDSLGQNTNGVFDLCLIQ